jgi:hypothetical protein
VVTVPTATGHRWIAQLELDERTADQSSALRIDVPGTFITQALAVRAAEGVLNEWRMGTITLREIVLRELAAAYRHLRETHKTMEPIAVPTTSTAWARAIDLWELCGWLDTAEAARYREHAERAFDASAARVKRHRLADFKPEPER